MMLIKAGCEIAYDCPAPTPMLLVLSLHPTRVPDLKTPQQLSFDRDVTPYDYVDAFGNVCTRIIAGAGRSTSASARYCRLAERSTRLSLGQPLLRNRPAQRHRVVSLCSLRTGLGAGA